MIYATHYLLLDLIRRVELVFRLDLKVFSAHNIYGMAAITALTAQTPQVYLL